MCSPWIGWTDAAAQALGSSRPSACDIHHWACSDAAHRCVHIGHGEVLMIHRWSIARRLFVAHLLFMRGPDGDRGHGDLRRRPGPRLRRGRPPDGRHRHRRRRQPLGAAGGERRRPVSAAAALRPEGHGRMPGRTSSPSWRRTGPGGRIPGTRSWASRTSGPSTRALHGQVFTEITAGTLGPSVRTIAPVKDADGNVRALVAAGVTVRTRGCGLLRPAAGAAGPRHGPAGGRFGWRRGCWGGTCAG